MNLTKRLVTYAAMTASILGVVLYTLFLYVTRFDPAVSPHFEVFSTFSFLNLVNIGACLFFLFKIDSNRTFLVGWAVLIVVLSVFSNPVYWYFRIRPHFSLH